VEERKTPSQETRVSGCEKKRQEQLPAGITVHKLYYKVKHFLKWPRWPNHLGGHLANIRSIK